MINPPTGRAQRGTPSKAAPRLALSVEEACGSLGVSWDLWREQIEPEVRIVRCGRRKLIPVRELEHWLEANAECPLEG
jgi:hypothetical protein